MYRNMKILVAIVVLVLILGIVVNPIFPLILGFLLLLALWGSIDAAGGNPYRRRHMDGKGIRGYAHSRAYYKPVEEKELKKATEVNTSVFIFFLGISQIIIGLIILFI